VTEYDDDDDDDDARATGRRGSASTAFHSVLWTRVRSPCLPDTPLVRVRDAPRRRPPVGAPCRWWLIKVYYNIRYGRVYLPPPAARERCPREVTAVAALSVVATVVVMVAAAVVVAAEREKEEEKNPI